MKTKAFTLVELMVVIAIIAILAVGSVTSYNSYLFKAELNKYRSAKVDGSKVQASDCLDSSADNCGPEIMIYSTYISEKGLTGIFKKDLSVLNPNDPGFLLVAEESYNPLISIDGKNVIYSAYYTGGIYQSSLNSTINSGYDGEALLTIVNAYLIAITPDGDSFIYSLGGNIYRKDFGTDPSIHGEIIDTVPLWTNSNVSLDGRYRYYTPSPSLHIYKKAIDDASSDLGEQITDFSARNPVLSSDKNSIIYQSGADGYFYKKSLSSPISDQGELIISSGSTGSPYGIVTFP